MRRRGWAIGFATFSWIAARSSLDESIVDLKSRLCLTLVKF
jgi:hypothetical protein